MEKPQPKNQLGPTKPPGKKKKKRKKKEGMGSYVQQKVAEGGMLSPKKEGKKKEGGKKILGTLLGAERDPFCERLKSKNFTGNAKEKKKNRHFFGRLEGKGATSLRQASEDNNCLSGSRKGSNWAKGF